ncbi:MAG: class A beta-lactamase, subclass A2 [Bacteroidales bacterium]|nr:class A beta-lactamase, subclass A2 [Bacteroidales bacterium]
MKRIIPLATFVFLIISCHTPNQKTDLLRNKIKQIVSDKNAVVGVSIIGNDGKDTISYNGDKRFPLQSVFKYHIALKVLSQIDEGKFSLEQKVEIQKKELLPDLWSPLREENPDGGSFSISKLIDYTVSLSDNVGCDVLLRLIGGPGTVEDYFKENNIKDISIKLNEETQQANWDLMFQNWITPKAANETLTKFYLKKENLLSETSYNFIWNVMKATETGKRRIKGQLPDGTIVAHKTGSSGTNNGITEAVNDIGIVFLPDGKYFFISVFITNSKEDEATNEKIIADIAKATWDYYSNPEN